MTFARELLFIVAVATVFRFARPAVLARESGGDSNPHSACLSGFAESGGTTSSMALTSPPDEQNRVLAERVLWDDAWLQPGAQLPSHIVDFQMQDSSAVPETVPAPAHAIDSRRDIPAADAAGFQAAWNQAVAELLRVHCQSLPYEEHRQRVDECHRRIVELELTRKTGRRETPATSGSSAEPITRPTVEPTPVATAETSDANWDELSELPSRVTKLQGNVDQVQKRLDSLAGQLQAISGDRVSPDLLSEALAGRRRDREQLRLMAAQIKQLQTTVQGLAARDGRSRPHGDCHQSPVDQERLQVPHEPTTKVHNELVESEAAVCQEFELLEHELRQLQAELNRALESISHTDSP